MELWTLLLLLHLAPCVSLPAPSNASISSFNMEHTLSFLPGPRTPSDARFAVEVLRSRRSSWRPVVSCSELTAGQTCNLTKAFKDPFDHYQARVQAAVPGQKSGWTVTGLFQPLSDTVLGPPDVSVSGCGNCLVLTLRLPAVKTFQQNPQLKDLYRELIFNVRRTRDGAQFSLSLPYKEETVITYLQSGVEYCVTVSVKSLFSSKAVSSAPRCALTSPPPAQSSLHVVFGLIGAFSVLALLFTVLVVHGGQLSFDSLRRRFPGSLSYFLLRGLNCGSAPPDLSGYGSASQLLDNDSSNCLRGSSDGPDGGRTTAGACLDASDSTDGF
ncbi:interferon alpha/beta receptor 2-like isoform X1 [Embiotoca jacksoni]|uniref:interferon alpha/beta receptor 2-like isoform X1 n=1 Tax=Embiotoca jacksoni TaxID=100190 RepID=UPI003703BD73